MGAKLSGLRHVGLQAGRELHRKHGTTYYLASRFFPAKVRDDVDALYGFVRTADEWVDNPAGGDAASGLAPLARWRSQVVEAYSGHPPGDPVLAAFVETALRTGIPHEEPLAFLDAMASDASVSEYATYEDLRGYMRGSAVAVGLMMGSILGVPMEGRARQGASDLAEAMQMTNFLRDVGEDLERGRLYLPLEDLAAQGLGRADLERREVTGRVRDLLASLIARTRGLYAASDPAIRSLPVEARRPVELARVLYARILDRIESNGYDVFRRRARTGRWERGVAVVATLARLR